MVHKYLAKAVPVILALTLLHPIPVVAGGHAPIGYQVMCLKNPNLSECKGGGASHVKSSPQLMATLKRVNNSVNARVTGRRDAQGVDVWNASASSGDCEEYAMAKRRALIKAGLPPSALRIAYVKSKSGSGHAVLIVKTGKSDLVLDVLTQKIRPLSQSGLRLISMAGANPRQWS